MERIGVFFWKERGTLVDQSTLTCVKKAWLPQVLLSAGAGLAACVLFACRSTQKELDPGSS